MGGFAKAFKEALPEMAAGLATAAVTGLLTSKTFRSFVKRKLSFLLNTNVADFNIDQYEKNNRRHIE
jgi:hypothetical protein